jgi:iron complex outermembrane receptor protein
MPTPDVCLFVFLCIAAPERTCAECSAYAPQRSGNTAESAITGIVRDLSGTAVPGASIVLRTASGGEQQTITEPDGRFGVVVATPGEIVLIVRADGFAERREVIRAGAHTQSIEIRLSPAMVSETVTVTATRVEQRIADVPASVTVLGHETIKRSPALVTDDLLRQIPTFSLFRRTSSQVSHPTAQGVSLRGIGPSGVSRTLVLLDGIPFNDSFGGWVYWSRVPLETVDRIEVVDSTSSSLYGNYAMGGVINIVTAPPARRTFELRSQYGSRRTPKLDVSASDVWGRVRAMVSGSVFDTDGYPPVVASERGLVDNNASVAFGNFGLKLQYDPTDRVHAFFRGGYFREERHNGKRSTFDLTEEANDTMWKSAGGGLRIRLPDDSDLQVNAFAEFTRFHSNFLAVPGAIPPRSLGRMTLDQRVPATGAGGLAQWSRAFGGNHVFTAGTDWRWVDGDSKEDGLDALTGTEITLKRISGGTQRSVGAFAQDVITPAARLMLTLGARLDHWSNYAGHNLETNFPSGVPTANHRPALPDRSNTVSSPRFAALYRASEGLSVWGSVGWGFRAPTLNELYRQFRVGNVLTLANDQLGPERLVGGEAGIRVAAGPNIVWRTTLFANRVNDPVSNVTISTTGTTVTQQRQNLGRTRIRGIQTDAEYRAGTFWRFSGGYLYDDARVREFAANPLLVGKLLPQVPKHRGSVQITYLNPRYVNVALGIESAGRQFDDDLNSRAVPGRSETGLPSYTLVLLTASRGVGRNLELFFGVQNLFDRQYFVGTLPTTTGTPRLVSGGVRVRLAARTAPR